MNKIFNKLIVSCGFLLSIGIGLSYAEKHLNNYSDGRNIVVAEVFGEPVFRAEVENAWSKFPEQGRPTRLEILDILVARQVLTHEALVRGLADKPQLKERLEQSRRKYVAKRLFESEVENKISVLEEDIQKIFKDQEYASKRRVRGRQIVVATAVQADSLYSLLREGADMATLARRFSLEQQSAPRGGDMGFWDETLMIGEVARRLFKLKTNEFSEPFQVEGYYHILRAEEAVPITYQDVRARLEKRIYDSVLHDREGAFKQALKERYKLRTDSDNLIYLIELNKISAHGMPYLKPDAELDRVLLRYEEGTVSLQKYLRWVELTPPNRRPVAVDTASIALFAMRTSIDSVLVDIEAERLGILQGDELTTYKQRRLDELLVEELRYQIAEEPLLNESILKTFYEANIERYTDPPLIYYEAIIVHNKQEGLEVRERLLQGHELWSVAQNYPRFYDEWRQYGVFHTEHKGVIKSEFPQVIEAVRQAKVGEIGGPFVVSFEREKGKIWNGYMVFRVLEHRATSAASFEDPIVQREVLKLVRAPLKNDIEAAFEKFLQEIMQKYEHEIKRHADKL